MSVLAVSVVVALPLAVFVWSLCRAASRGES
jgi:hypothetical protein